jgi:hypothetical protein
LFTKDYLVLKVLANMGTRFCSGFRIYDFALDFCLKFLLNLPVYLINLPVCPIHLAICMKYLPEISALPACLLDPLACLHDPPACLLAYLSA